MEDELQRSVDMETQADLLAMNFRFGDASALMKQVNRIRSDHFGHGLNPNDLRERSVAALRAAAEKQPEGENQ